MMHSHNVSSGDFRQSVIEESHSVPVLVDFWAHDCVPCAALRPVLEELAAEYAGRIRLVTVNIEENPDIVEYYKVRAIPTVMVFINGKRADEFSGAIPREAVRDFIERLFPSTGELLRKQALDIARHGEKARALSLLEMAMAIEPDYEPVKVEAARLMLELGKGVRAQQLLAGLSAAPRQAPGMADLLARAHLAPVAPDDLAALEQRVGQEPEDLEARMQLASHYASEQRYPDAMDQLLEVMKRDRHFQEDAPRQKMLAIFQLLKNQPDLINTYRRRMASTLF